MTTAISKRNQARNEKALQELLKNVPGNDRCADCQARNPGWASWSLGIFLCMRCAAIHRKLGTHISKVKSLSMDSWTNEQVENMTKVGNVNSNKIWNPQNKQPTVPIDVDEVDGAVEKFIRQKYEQKVFSGGRAAPPRLHSQSTPSMSSAAPSPMTPSFPRNDDNSPPPSAKSSKKFGFGLRAATSTFHLGKPKGRERKSSLPTTGRVVGATIGIKEDELGMKLVTLKEMGFHDEKRNSEVLKGLNGDLERAIESLVRLGQNSGSDAMVRKQVSKSFERDPDRFPQPPERSSSKTVTHSAGVMGATVHQSPQTTGMGAGAVQSSAGSPSFNKTSHNPFNNAMSAGGQSAQAAFEQAFGNMSVSQQPLSSQSTGILPSQQPAQQVLYQQSMTPPPMGGYQQPSNFNPYQQMMQQQPQQVSGYYPNQQYQSQYAQPLSVQSTGNNPFFQAQMQSTPLSSPSVHSMQGHSSANPFFQQLQAQSTGNPFLQQINTATYPPTAQSPGQPISQVQYMDQTQNMSQSPASFQAPGFPMQQQQQQQQQQYQQQPQQMQQYMGQQNPFQQQMMAQQGFNQQQFQQQQFQQPYMQQPLMTQPTGRFNKQSIMALYGGSSLAAQPSIPEHPEQAPAATSSPPPAAQPQAPVHIANNRRSVTMPATMSTGNNNPFAIAQAPAQATPGAGRVRDSIFADGANDAFATLSAKFVR